jgi:hypothetical protein
MLSSYVTTFIKIITYFFILYFTFLFSIWNKIPKFVYGPSITHKDDHFAKKCKINLINYNKDMKSDSKNTLWYKIKLITMGDNSWNSWDLTVLLICRQISLISYGLKKNSIERGQPKMNIWPMQNTLFCNNHDRFHELSPIVINFILYHNVFKCKCGHSNVMDPLFWHIRLVLLYIKIIYTFQIYGISEFGPH